MNHDSFLNWPDDYLKACQQFGIDPAKGLEPFLICLSPICYFALTTSTTVDHAMKIFERFEHAMPKIDVDKITKQTHINHINKLQEFILTKGIEDEKEYLENVNAWYKAVKLMLPPLQINTSNGIVIEISKDCCLLCNCMRCVPVELLQYFVNHVAIPETGAMEREKMFVTRFFVENLPIEYRL